MKKVNLMIMIIILMVACYQQAPIGPEILPDLKLKEFKGQERLLSNYKFKVLIVNFWATWCEPCKEEIPYLNNLYDRYKDKGVLIIGITEDDEKYVEKFIKKIPINYPIILDDGSATEIFKVIGYPMTYIYNNERKLFTQAFGIQKKYYFENKINELIRNQ